MNEAIGFGQLDGLRAGIMQREERRRFGSALMQIETAQSVRVVEAKERMAGGSPLSLCGFAFLDSPSWPTLWFNFARVKKLAALRTDSEREIGRAHV